MTPQFNADATRAAAMTEDSGAAMTQDGGAAIFDLAAGKAEYHKLSFLPEKAPALIYPLAGRPELLVHYGNAEKEKNFMKRLTSLPLASRMQIDDRLA